MPDDSEDIYVPTGPDDLDQESTLQELTRVQIESTESKESLQKTETEFKIVTPSKPYRPFTAGNLEEPITLNLNYKDVFPELNLEELPPQIKYKLPVSEQYDPEGKMVKQKRFYNEKIKVDYGKIRNLTKERKEVSQNIEDAFKVEMHDANKVKMKEISKESKHLNILEEESELRKIKQTALHVIEDNLSKAISVAKTLKNKPGVTLSDTLEYEINREPYKTQEQIMQTEKRSSKQSCTEKVKTESKKVSFKDDYQEFDYQEHEKEMSSDEASKREVHVADEVKKFETFDIQMDSKLNAEERKLLTRQDIEEAIEAGTVRQRTGMFKTGTDRLMTNKHEKKLFETVKSDVKTNIELAKQNVYNIGLKVIPRIRNAVQFSRQSNFILKRFILQMTKIMITLYRFIPIEKRYNLIKSKEIYERNKKGCEYIHKIDLDDEAFRRDVYVDESGEIRKPKLSGAKIAQIEGLKPAELTDRMNIVISEFLRKSGKEEIIDERKYHRSQTSISKKESTVNDEFMNDISFREKAFDKSQTGEPFSTEPTFRENTFDKSQTEEPFSTGPTFRKNTFDKGQTGDAFSESTYFREETFDKSHTGDEFLNGKPFREKAFDNKKIFEETYETKTKTYEIREIKEEKRHSESKTSKFDSKQRSYETTSTSRDDVTVPLTYIAIVEAHVYTNKNAIFEEQRRRMSESMKQSDVTESGVIYYRCEVSVFYRHFREPSLPPTVVIESIEEIPSEDVFEEEKQDILQSSSTAYEDTAKTLAVQKISEVIEPLLQIKEVKSVNIKHAYPAIEKPLKVISEQTSVTMEKEENITQESNLLTELTHITMERPVKTVVETSEIKEEEKREFVETFETDQRKPKPSIEPTTKSIAETTEIFIEEETVGMVDIPQPIAQIPKPVKVEKTIKSVAETNEVIVDEANLKILDSTKTISATPRYTIADNLRSIAETMVAIIAEPQSENMKDVSKITGEKVEVGVDEIVASEIFEVFPEEPVYEEIIHTETKRRQSEVFLEKSLLVLPEITLTSAEEPICEELIVSKAQSKEAKVDMNAKVVAEITEVSLSEREQETFDVVKIVPREPGTLKEESVLSVSEIKTILPFEPPAEPFDSDKVINHQASLTIEESKAIETMITQVEEPKEKAVNVLECIEKHTQAFMEEKFLSAAETFIILPEEPKVSFDTVESLKQQVLVGHQASLTIEESKAIETIITQVEEPKVNTVDVFDYIEKHIEAFIEEKVLTAAETFFILPEEPKVSFDTVENLKQQVHVGHQASLTIEESKAVETTIIHAEEPKVNTVDVFEYIEKRSHAFVEETFLTVAETFFILPEEPKVSFDIVESLKQQAHVEIMELKTATVTTVSVEEPKQDIVRTPKVSNKEPNTGVEASLLTVAENTIILPEGPHHGFLEIPKLETKRPKPVLEGSLLVAETIEVMPTSPEEGFNLVETIIQHAHISIEESKAITTLLVHLEEPKEDTFSVLTFLEKKPQVSLQGVSLTVPVIIEILPEGPRDEYFITPKPVEEKANIDIEELKTASVTVVSVEEPKNENIDKFTYTEKELESLLEKPILNVAETLTTIPEGPLYDKFEPPVVTGDKANIIIEEIKPLTIGIVTPNEPQEQAVDVPQVKDIKPQSLIEGRFLPVVETVSVVPEESKVETYAVTKRIDEQAKINIQVSETAETTIINVGEPKEVIFEVPRYEEKKPATLNENIVFTVPEIIEIIPNEPKGSFTVPSVINEQADVKIREFKSTSTTVVYPDEPKLENLELPVVKTKQQQPKLEAIHLAAAETSLILLEESGTTLDITKASTQQANIEVIEQKAAEGTIMLKLDSRQEDLVIPEVKQKIPQTLFESPVLIAAENFIIVSEEKVDELQETVKPQSQSATVYLKGLKVADTIILFSEEPMPEKVEVLKLDKSEIQPTVVDKYFAVAETLFLLPFEPKEEILNISKFTKTQAYYGIEEARAHETTVISIEEPRNKEFTAPGFSTRKSENLVEKAVKTVALVTVVYTSEVGIQFTVFSKSIAQEGKLTYEAYAPVIHTINIVYEDAASYASKCKLISNQAKVVIVESTATAVANITSVAVSVAKEEIVDVTKYTVELAEEQVEKEAALKVSVDIKDIDLSSVSSTISSAPSSPLIQEYVFGVAGHEYRVQSPQETSLDIIQPAKEVYGVGSADTSYTLAFEAAYEEEKEILHMEEFKDEVKNKQFWISDVKTMEILESSDARMQLMDVRMGDVRKSQSKYASVQDSAIEVKSRSQSFDTSADFEVSLQSFEEAQARETKISEVQAAATFALKSEASFKTVEDVESQAKINIKSKSAKAYTAQSVDIAYGLTIENEIEVKGQSMELDVQALQDTKIAKSSKRRVKKGAKAIVSESSETDIEARYNYEADLNLESRSISKQSYASAEESLQSSQISEANYLAIEGKLESSGVSKGSFTSIEINEESNAVSEANYIAMQKKLESSKVSKSSSAAMKAKSESSSIFEGSYIDVDASLESKSVSKAGYAAIESSGVSKGSVASIEANLELNGSSEANYIAIQRKLDSSKFSKSSSAAMNANLEASAIFEGSYTEVDASLESRSVSKGFAAIEASSISESSYSSEQASLESKSSRAIEMDARHEMTIQEGSAELTYGSSKLDGRHKLSLEIDLKGTTTHVLKSPSPEDIPSTPLRDEYIFRLHTPVPEETTFVPRDCSFTRESVHEEPLVIVKGMIPHIDTKIVRILYSPPLDTPPTSPYRKVEPVFTKPGLKGGSETPEFTKEEILEIGRKSALLASAIDKTIRSIEEYKESVGIGDKKETGDTEREGKLYEHETVAETSVQNRKVKSFDIEEKKTKETKVDQLTELDVRKTDSEKSRKSILSRFSQF